MKNHEHDFRDDQRYCWCAEPNPNFRSTPEMRPVAAAIGDAGLQRAVDAAQADWVRDAESAWHTLSLSRSWATAAHLGEAIPNPPKGSRSALGQVMRTGAKNEWWTKTDRTWVPPGKTYHNSKPLPVWLSKNFVGHREKLPAHCETCTCV